MARWAIFKHSMRTPKKMDGWGRPKWMTHLYASTASEARDRAREELPPQLLRWNELVTVLRDNRRNRGRSERTFVDGRRYGPTTPALHGNGML